jgi:hypothetical protein
LPQKKKTGWVTKATGLMDQRYFGLKIGTREREPAPAYIYGIDDQID